MPKSGTPSYGTHSTAGCLSFRHPPVILPCGHSVSAGDQYSPISSGALPIAILTTRRTAKQCCLTVFLVPRHSTFLTYWRPTIHLTMWCLHLSGILLTVHSDRMAFSHSMSLTFERMKVLLSLYLAYTRRPVRLTFRQHAVSVLITWRSVDSTTTLANDVLPLLCSWCLCRFRDQLCR